MSTQEQRRRAIGTSLTDGRQSSRRTDTRRAVDDLNSLISQPKRRVTLKELEAIGALAATRGRGDYVPPAAGGGGGIASPLTEPSYAAREYHPEQVLVSTDGLLSFRYKPIKKIVQEDAGANVVEQVFAAPPVPTS